jgi:ParB family transcriptional regulator, chromosome partitioning protein
VSARLSGLGRGFDSLIPSDLIDESLDPTADQDGRLSDLREIKLTEIVANPDQPRKTFDEQALVEMTESIKEHGVIQPIVVTPVDGSYEIVAGERRYRGAVRAGLEKIPALVRTLTDQHKLELSLIENLQRRDLNVLETATAYLKLRDQFNLSLEEIGTRVGGKSTSSVSNTLRLLRLPESVRKALQDGRLTEGQARPLINADPEVIESILPQILRDEWSARKIEQFVVDLKTSKKVITSGVVTPHHETAVKQFTESFLTKVQIRSNTKGAGQIVISFKDDNDFDRITNLLNKN